MLNLMLNASSPATVMYPYIYVIHKNCLFLRNSQEPPYSFVKQNFLTVPSVLYMKKNFYLKKALQLWESRMIDERYLHNTAVKIPKPIGLHHLSGIFFVWIAGSLIGFFALFIEMIICLSLKLKVYCTQM